MLREFGVAITILTSSFVPTLAHVLSPTMPETTLAPMIEVDDLVDDTTVLKAKDPPSPLASIKRA